MAPGNGQKADATGWRPLRRNVAGLGALVAVLLLGAVGVVGFGQTSAGGRDNPVVTAWAMAQDSGSYRFRSDLTQTVTPASSVLNAGRTSRSERLHLAGHADLDANALEFDLWTGGSGQPAGDADLSLRHVDGRTFQQTADGEWLEASDATGVSAPGGDLMGYLSSAREVTLTDSMELGGVTYDRYSFTIDGPAYAAAMADRMRESLRGRPGAVIDTSATLRSMTGSGELWVDEEGYPVRQAVAVRFPERNGDHVDARVEADFSEFGAPVHLGVASDPTQTAPWDFLRTAVPGWLLVALSAMALALLATRRLAVRGPLPVQGVAILLAVSMIAAGPVPAAEAADAGAPAVPEEPDPSALARDALATGPLDPVDPHQSLLATGPSSTAGATTRPNRPQAAPATTRQADPTADQDLDGLSDAIEEDLGLDPDDDDTDGDGLLDGIEVEGFTFPPGGQAWYPDPFTVDSNHDGIADGLEYDNNDDGTPDDTDGDGVPDLFDDDNDGDGVVDRLDLTSSASVATVFDQDGPFRFGIDGLTDTDTLPVYVDFQLRPINPDHLRLAYSAFDWPRDELGQIRDIDGRPDDVQLVPMLEIALPDPAHQLPDPDELSPFAVTVSDADDAGARVAYVPLSLVTDDTTGAAIAFNGRMRYRSQAAWGEDHEARLVWAVSMANDVPCDPEVDAPCESDGYLYNQIQIVHRYTDDWRLTGLQVAEQHGAQVAVAYEDPAVDSDIHDPGPTWALSHVLDQRFMAASDDGAGGLEYEVTVDTLTTDYDHRANGGNTPHGLPDVFAVETADYESFDEAAYATASTEAPRILAERFDGRWTGDDSIRPLLLMAYSMRTRTTSTNAMATADPSVTNTGGRLHVDLAPDGAPRSTIDTIVGMKWTEFCGGSGGAPAWRACTPEETYAAHEARYASTPLDDGAFPGVDTTDPDIAAGQNMVMYLHAMAMQGGQTAFVERDPGDGTAPQAIHQYIGETDPAVDTVVALSLGSGTGGIAKVVANLAIFPYLEDANDALRRLNALGTRGKFNQLWSSFGIKGQAAIGVGIGIGVLALIGVAAYAQFGDSPGAAAALNLTLAAGQLVAGVIGPIYSVAQVVRAGEMTALTALTSASETVGMSKAAGVIGLIISLLAIWGFTIYGVVSSGLVAFSAEFNGALADGFAASYTVALLTALSFTVVGLIIVAIVAVIDLLLLGICNLGVDALESDATNGGCFTLSGAFTEFVSKVLYSYDIMVDLEREGLIDVGEPDISLVDPSTGFAVGGQVNVDVPVTTNIAHSPPDGADSWQMVPYLWFYTPDNLRSSTFTFSLTEDEEDLTAERGTMAGEWDTPEFDDEYLTRDLYRTDHGLTQTYTGGFPLVEPGINRELKLTFNSAFAVPASECWTVPWAGLLPVPVCYKRSFEESSSSELDSLYFDVLPATLDDFVNVPASGDAVTWEGDTRPVGSHPVFPTLGDVDRDGVLSNQAGGLDPDDRRWDTDFDGLSDAKELELRQDGIAVSPGLADTDLDGLDDARELAVGTNPGVADTDNDGLTDAQEVNGWDISVTGHWDLVNETTRTVRVTSDPRQPDGDNDGVSDLAEWQLAQPTTDPANRVDEDGRAFHPLIVNVSPLDLRLSVDDDDGFVVPGQALTVRTEAEATVPVVPGVLDLATSSQLDGDSPPTVLGFDPSTFSDSQTVVRETTMTVGGGATGQAVVSADARTRLEDIGPGGVDFTVNAEAAITGTREAALLDVAVRHPDRGDSFLLAEAARDYPFPDASDVRNIPLPQNSGPVQLDSDREPHTPRRDDYEYQSAVDPSVACNDAGECMTAWTHYDNCTTVSVNWITVPVMDGGDPGGSSGIEPGLYLRRNPSDPTYRTLWFTASNGGNDMTQGEGRGPNALGFPTGPTAFCGAATFYAFEIDGSSGNPSAGLPLRRTRYTGGDWVYVGTHFPLDEAVPRTTTVSFASDDFITDHTSCGVCIRIEVNMTVAPRQAYRVVGAVTNAAGQKINSGFTTPFDPVTGDVAVASDGTNFAIVSEDRDSTFTGGAGSSAQPSGTRYVRLRTYNSAGQHLDTQTVASFSGSHTGKAWFDVEWTGEDWLVAVQHPTTADIKVSRINFDGGPVPSATLATNVNTANPWYAFGLAHDPVLDRSLLAYSAQGGDTAAVVFDADLVPLATDTLLAGWGNPAAAHNPLTGGWLVTAARTNSTPKIISVGPLLEDPDVRAAGGVGVSSLPTVACPSPSALPVTDLRFEELPGATTFADASPLGNDATAGGASGPTSGHPGAPDAAASDHAIEFDGSADTLSLPNPVADEVSLAFWYRGEPAATGQPLVLSAGGTGGYGLSISPSGDVAWTVGGSSVGGPVAGINDGDWHFVTATRRASGRIAVHVDGAVTASASTSSAPDAAPTLTITGGGARVGLDHLRVYRTGLSSDVVAQLYDRTDSAFCVTASTTVNSGGTGQHPWARLAFNEIDPRGGRLQATDQIRLTIDDDLPSSTVFVAASDVHGTGQTLVVGGSASDPTSDVALVEVRVNGRDWAPANGTDAWTFPLQLTDGPNEVQSRATDSVGNVEVPQPPVTVVIDDAAPVVGLDPLPSVPVTPGADPGTGLPTVGLAGTVSDPIAGLTDDGVEVQLVRAGAEAMERGWQVATIAGDRWSIDYRFGGGANDVTGTYNVRVRATDRAGNATPDDAATGVLRLDDVAPDATLSPADVAREYLAGAPTIGGTVTDNGGSGINTVEIAFTSIQAVEAGDPPDWQPVVLSDSGPGVASSDWSFSLPGWLEDFAQVDLRTTDHAGNTQEIRNLWRGVVDTRAPLVVLEFLNNGRTIHDGSQHDFSYRCVATDLFLSADEFDCPGNGLREPTRTVADDPVLQAQFPDQVLLTGLELGYHTWEVTDSPVATFTACDRYGNCASANTVEERAAVRVTAPPVHAHVVVPRPDDHLASDGNVGLHVAAGVDGDSDSLATVVVRIDGVEFDRHEFGRGAVRSIDLPVDAVLGGGPHNVAAQATTWEGLTVDGDPVDFFVDLAAPVVSVATTDITVADTWGVGTDMVRLSGTVSDDGQIVAVQVNVDGQGWTEAIVDATAGTWRVAVLVPDGDGRDVPIAARAIDLAGRMTEVSVAGSVALAAQTYDRPKTIITNGPPTPTMATSATVEFGGDDGENDLAGFDCRLDGGDPEPCDSPWSVSGLSAGEHTVAVVAVDTEGLEDLTPATHTWTVEPSGPQVVLMGVPDNPTDQRTAQFVFLAGQGATTECSLDGEPFQPCTSPVQLGDLALGNHRFAIRVTAAGVTGTATVHKWSVVNLPPVAVDQSVTVLRNDADGQPVRLRADDADDLTYRIVERPTRGLLVGTGADLTYVPFLDYTGSDQFTFVADDGQNVSNVGAVSVVVRGPITPLPPEEPEEPAEPTPLDGGDPIAAAIAISQTRYPTTARQAAAGPDHVVLSRDDDFADSLAASVLTGTGPLLFTESDTLDERTEAEIARVLDSGGTVILLGGDAAISLGVEARLIERGFVTTRLAGVTRIETALAVADHALAAGAETGPLEQVAIARAYGTPDNPTAGWADAVSAGGWAAFSGTPILLTPTDQSHPAVAEWLADHRAGRHVVLGGTAAVSDAAVASLSDVQRVAGPNRFATAAAIAEQLWDTAPDGWLVTSGTHVDGWAYALAAAGLSADRQDPLLLVEAGRLPVETDQPLACADGVRPPIEVVGGLTVVDQVVRDALTTCPA